MPRYILFTFLAFLYMWGAVSHVSAQDTAFIRVTLLPERLAMPQPGSNLVSVLIENFSDQAVEVVELELLPRSLSPALIEQASVQGDLPFVVHAFSTDVRDYSVLLLESGNFNVIARITYRIEGNLRLSIAHTTISVTPAPPHFWQGPIGLQLIGAALALTGGFISTQLLSWLARKTLQQERAIQGRTLLNAWLAVYAEKIQGGYPAPPDLFTDVLLKENLYGMLVRSLPGDKQADFEGEMASLYTELGIYSQDPSAYQEDGQKRIALITKVQKVQNYIQPK